jgi:hypothetical protein
MKNQNLVKLEEIVIDKRIPCADMPLLTAAYDSIPIQTEFHTKEFMVDCLAFYDVIEATEKNHVNFVFIERSNKLDIMLHLSNKENDIEPSDKIYNFDGSDILKPVEIKSLDVYWEERNKYKIGLGAVITEATQIAKPEGNTQVISYTRIKALDFERELRNELSSADIMYLHFRMIQFIPIEGSDLNASYRTRPRNISFGVSLFYRNGTEIKQTHYYDIGHLHP